MNSLSITEAKRRPLTEQIYAIIDTKIQYIDYQTNKMISSMLGNSVNDAPKPSKQLDDFFKFDKAHSNCDSFLDRMEEYSKTKRLLLIMRSQISDENAKFILGLLSDNTFLKFDEKYLKILFKVEPSE